MTPNTSRLAHPLLALAVLTCGAAFSAHAIQPQRWTHSTEADFEAGELDRVVVTNLGDLKLATAVETLGEFPEEVSVIYDIAIAGDTTYIAAGPEATLFQSRNGELREVEIPLADNGQIFALLEIMDGVVAAISKPDGSYLIGYGEAGEAWRTPAISLPETRYIWDLATPDGKTIVVATGAEGKVLSTAFGEQQKITELLDTAQANVLCLAAAPDGTLYAGTDTDGLVYRLDTDGSVFVAYDADEPEIGALLVAEDGSVYVGTADAEQATPGRMEDPTEEETGRPEPEGDAEAAPPAELPGDPEPQPLDAAEGAEAAEGVAEETEAGAGAATEEAAAEDSAAEDSAKETEIAEAGPPSPEQLDALREEVRKRLLAARKSGKVAAGPASGKSAARPTRNARPASTGGDKSGNAVYRIDTQGFVSEVFRESVAVLDLVEQADGHILVGTGSEGQLYRLDPAAGETSVLNDLEAQQLLTLVVADDRILVGGSNPAALIELSDETAGEGRYTSDVLDATHISLWGTFLVTAQGMGDNDTVQVETRSGNVSDPEIAAWSEWSVAESVTAQVADPLQPREYTIGSPPARFLQYRLTLQGGDAVEAGGPTVGKVELAYVTPNLRPSVSSFTAAYPDFAGVDQPASPAMSIGWEATDENGDRLLYDLEFKPAAATKNGWLPLVEDLADASYEWDTRKVPDGRYHLRVTADDRLDNPGDMAMQARRLADPVLIDNTPPAAGELKVEVTGTTAKVSATAKDAYSPIQSVAYTLDDAKEYTPVLPDDLIYDSTSEAWSATLSDLSPGGHSLTVRTLDARGNATYTSTLFEVK